MKKKLFLAFFSFFLISLSAQNSYEVANTNTAVRCLKIAENFLLNGDWQNALRQADLGLSYDESISDLIYVKAAAQMNLDCKKADVILLVKSAFERDNWINYKKNGARILLADLLCDTGLYEDSMQVLDSEPLIYSSDAEFIRIKNLYRMGTEKSIESARLKLNSAIRIYPSDMRFADIFFMFEILYLENAAIDAASRKPSPLQENIETEEKSDFLSEYKVPSVVKSIANHYISVLPDYSGKNLEMELLASFFAEKEMQKRLVRAIDSKEQTIHPLLACAGLQTGLYSEDKAFNLFFESTGNSILLSDLEFFALHLKENDVKQRFIERLLNFDGTILIDCDSDLQNEISVHYETGRPLNFDFDANNDGKIELYAECDFGSPSYIQFYDDFHKNSEEYDFYTSFFENSLGKLRSNANCGFFYEKYPSVSKSTFGNDVTLNFFGDDCQFSPIIMEENCIFSDFGLHFYVPSTEKTDFSFTFSDFVKKAISAEYPIEERENAKAVYTIFGGQKVSAIFLENEKSYAFCNFSKMPFARSVDFDGDGYFETTETYDYVTDETSSLFDKDFILRIFGKNLENEKIYLKKVQIDRNANSFYEFSEEYLNDDGKISLWDNDDDGRLDCKYIRFPKKDDEPLKEESSFYDSNGQLQVSISFIDKIPVKMTEKNGEVLINAGENKNFYWIEEVQSAELENEILQSVKTDIVQGAVTVFESKKDEENNKVRVSVIKVEQNFFCKVLPNSENYEEN